MAPKISVVMTVYNSAPYLAEAMESILGQTFGDFEFILVDDASTDDSVAVIESFRDKRIKLIRSSRNGGPAVASNKGFDAARGEYIIRMDSDDISVPDRFEKQLDYMENHPGIGVCGSWMRAFGDNVPASIWQYPLVHDDIRAHQIFMPKMSHSAVIMRKSIIDRHHIRYDASFRRALDYDFWVRHADKWQYANTSDILVLYRRHQGQITTSHYDEQQQLAGRVRRRELARLGIEPDAEQFGLHQRISMNRYEADPGFLRRVRDWLHLLLHANRERVCYQEGFLERVLAEKWVEALSAATVQNPLLADEIWSSLAASTPLYAKAALPEWQVKPEKLDALLHARPNHKIAILGTGRAAVHLYRVCSRKYDVDAFVDRNPALHGQHIFRVPVVPPDALHTMPDLRGGLLLSSILGEHDRQVMAQLDDIVRGLELAVASWKDLV